MEVVDDPNHPGKLLVLFNGTQINCVNSVSPGMLVEETMKLRVLTRQSHHSLLVGVPRRGSVFI